MILPPSHPLRLAILTCGTIVTNGHLCGLAAQDRGEVDVLAFTSRTRTSAARAAVRWGSGNAIEEWR